jgi:hypothetical protein
MRLRGAASLDEIYKARLARLKFGVRHTSTEPFVTEPHPKRVEHVALAVVGNLPECPSW